MITTTYEVLPGSLCCCGSAPPVSGCGCTGCSHTSNPHGTYDHYLVDVYQNPGVIDATFAGFQAVIYDLENPEAGVIVPVTIVEQAVLAFGNAYAGGTRTLIDRVRLDRLPSRAGPDYPCYSGWQSPLPTVTGHRFRLDQFPSYVASCKGMTFYLNSFNDQSQYELQTSTPAVGRPYGLAANTPSHLYSFGSNVLRSPGISFFYKWQDGTWAIPIYNPGDNTWSTPPGFHSVANRVRGMTLELRTSRYYQHYWGGSFSPCCAWGCENPTTLPLTLGVLDAPGTPIYAPQTLNYRPYVFGQQPITIDSGLESEHGGGWGYTSSSGGRGATARSGDEPQVLFLMPGHTTHPMSGSSPFYEWCLRVWRPVFVPGPITPWPGENSPLPGPYTLDSAWAESQGWMRHMVPASSRQCDPFRLAFDLQLRDPDGIVRNRTVVAEIDASLGDTHCDSPPVEEVTP
jgi:hypothetical protein